jgi:hypothetical protein
MPYQKHPKNIDVPENKKINIINPILLILNTHRCARTSSWMWAPAALPSWKSSCGLSWCEWVRSIEKT